MALLFLAFAEDKLLWALKEFTLTCGGKNCLSSFLSFSGAEDGTAELAQMCPVPRTRDVLACKWGT